MSPSRKQQGDVGVAEPAPAFWSGVGVALGGAGGPSFRITGPAAWPARAWPRFASGNPSTISLPWLRLPMYSPVESGTRS